MVDHLKESPALTCTANFGDELLSSTIVRVEDDIGEVKDWDFITHLDGFELWPVLNGLDESWVYLSHG